jgi:hypothetical protein
MSGAPPYFVDHKRGEVNELKMLLNNPKLLREQDKKREVIKKVIAYMTLGIDVSKVFSEMVMVRQYDQKFASSIKGPDTEFLTEIL